MEPNWKPITIIASKTETKEEYVCHSCSEKCKTIVPLNKPPNECTKEK